MATTLDDLRALAATQSLFTPTTPKRAILGYVKAPPRDRAFKRELAAELDRMGTFLGLEDHGI